VGINQDINDQLQEKLDERKANGLFRSLVCADHLVDFSSNDYLGFARLKELRPSNFDEELKAGATGSRLISGNSKLAEETEHIIAQYHNANSALIFNSGYDANLGLLSCIAGRNDTIITDQLVHASIIDGARLSHAHRFTFLHNDVEDLDKKLEAARGNKFVVVESIYSMDGDAAPLTTIAEICAKRNAALIVDEAHATGVYGDKGEGLVAMQGLEEKVFARVITFGKALGLHGAAVLGSPALRNYLINHARSFIYSTALPPISYLQLQAAYKHLPYVNRDKLFELVDHFTTSAAKLTGLSFIKSTSPIQGIIAGSNEKAKALSKKLEEQGFFAKAILSPTVPVGTERLRICIHAFNTKEEVDRLLMLLAEMD
jgi:8-amino-7-oxononanoate synthase